MQDITSLVLPAAGLAVRMRGLPKFALPVGPDGMSLLRIHAEAGEKNGMEVLVLTRTEWAGLVDTILKGTNARVSFTETATGSETVVEGLSTLEGRHVVVSLPDTYVTSLEDDLKRLVQELGRNSGTGASGSRDSAAAVTYLSTPSQLGQLGTCVSANGRITSVADKQRVEGGARHWGVIGASREMWRQGLDPSSPHAGYLLEALLNDNHTISEIASFGRYFDCGTLREYASALRWSLDE